MNVERTLRVKGISIMSGHNSGPVCSSSERVRQLEDLQFFLGEGPCHDAHATDATITEPDIVNMTNSRWPSYTPLDIELGACAVFAFPLHVGVETVGLRRQSRPGCHNHCSPGI